MGTNSDYSVTELETKTQIDRESGSLIVWPPARVLRCNLNTVEGLATLTLTVDREPRP